MFVLVKLDAQLKPRRCGNPAFARFQDGPHFDVARFFQKECQ
jgi:hypothetical protein